MSKKLSEMSLKELWRLFPIMLTEHKDCWARWYEEELKILKSILPSDINYYHIGSTAINGIWAKPIVDILIVVNSYEEMLEAARLLQSANYITMSADDKRISLNKGYTENGFAERVFHLHLRLADDTDEIYFKDYLNARPEAAKEYEALKLKLWKKYEFDRNAYTEAKTEFIKKYTDLAKSETNKS